MTYEEKVNFLKQTLTKRPYYLGIKKDLSRSPEIFGHELRMRGLYIHGRALTETSKILSSIECDVILYNETNPQKVSPPEGYDLFRIKDLQEFPYIAAIRIHKE